MHPFRFSLVLAVLTLVGCSSGPGIPAPSYPGIERSDVVRIADLRPASESQKEIFSLMIHSNAYGISRVPDAATAPTGRAYSPIGPTRPFLSWLNNR